MRSIREKLGSLVLVVALTVTGVIYAGNKVQATTEEKVINDFWASFKPGSKVNWYDFMASGIKNNYKSFAIDSKNKENCTGILAVKKADLLRVYSVSAAEAPYYKELEAYHKEYYRVVVNLETYRQNKYFTNGINEYYMTVVEDKLGKKIGSLSKRYPQYNDKFGWGFADPDYEPSTINVKDSNGVVHYDYNFRDFVFNVICNEIGNSGFDQEAVKSHIIAVKMSGWWAVRAGYRAAEGCDIRWGDVNFLDHNLATSDNQRFIDDCMSEAFDYSAYASNGKIFYMNYEAGSYNGNGENGGIFKEYGSDYLAGLGYSWRDILHYYYDNSALNNPNTGTIEIR